MTSSVERQPLALRPWQGSRYAKDRARVELAQARQLRLGAPWALRTRLSRLASAAAYIREAQRCAALERAHSIVIHGEDVDWFAAHDPRAGWASDYDRR